MNSSGTPPSRLTAPRTTALIAPTTPLRFTPPTHSPTMPTKLATLLPALCALTLAAGSLACSTSESNSPADPPPVADPSPTAEHPTSEPSSNEQPASANEPPDASPEDANRYTQLHFEMTIEVDGDVKSRPQIHSMPGMPVTVSQNGGGERPVQFLLEMTPTFVGENIALAGTIEGKVGEEVAHAQAIDAQVALGEPMAIAFELDGMAYVIEMVVQKSEYQRDSRSQ